MTRFLGAFQSATWRRALLYRAPVAAIAIMIGLGSSGAGQMAGAQSLECTTSNSAFPDACRKVGDLFAFLSPQVGVALSGGNFMLGEGGALGGSGKASLSVHASVVDGRVPSKIVPFGTSATPASSDFGASRAPIPMPSVDAALGLFRGYTVGLTNVGGIDLLVGATYVPDVSKNHVNIRTDGSSLAVSYGVRLGILQESAIVPGVSVSYRHRRLPTSTFLYTTDNDTLSVHGLALSSNSFRLVAAKRFVFIGIGGGVGRDKIDATTAFSFDLHEPNAFASAEFPLATQKVTRSTAFANLSFGLPKAQLTIEAGWSSKGDVVTTVNTFGGHSANEGYRYGSIGFGFRL